MQINSTTKLAAVNTMLFTIGESPVNTLSGGSGVDAVTAVQTLDAVAREVQSEGWAFNTEKSYPLLRQAFAPLVIYVPDAALECDPSDPTAEIVVRGNRLYDLKNHTFEFPDTPKINCDIIWNFEFDELPETARRYITIRASRIFQDGAVGSETLHTFTERDEFQARARFRKGNSRVRDKNLLRGSASVARILQR
jgi:hypothetical protein